MKRLFYAMFILLIATTSFAAEMSIELTWDPNSEPDLAGYRVFHRPNNANYDYTNPSWEGAEVTSTITGLDPEVIHCFVVRAFDTGALESVDSIEVCSDLVNVPPAAPSGLQIISKEVVTSEVIHRSVEEITHFGFLLRPKE